MATLKFIVNELDDGSVFTFDTLEDVYKQCESIDVLEGVYDFKDSDGYIYDVIWITKPKVSKFFFGISSITQGKYKLVKRD